MRLTGLDNLLVLVLVAFGTKVMCLSIYNFQRAIQLKVYINGARIEGQVSEVIHRKHLIVIVHVFVSRLSAIIGWTLTRANKFHTKLLP